ENIRGTQRDARRSACAGARRNHRPHCAVQINPGEVRARTRGICEPCLEASRSRRSRRVARCCTGAAIPRRAKARAHIARKSKRAQGPRSEEHTSELQSHLNLVCRLLLEKKNTA